METYKSLDEEDNSYAYYTIRECFLSLSAFFSSEVKNHDLNRM